ncbi:efflux transporter outer membrane subunit [Thalassotalea sp. HSM 43]|uniref:efflux transporter outer membrane subunit n=1 Tax=Thalassotalea sp. HSM 43 TaxID=2552945 RepID=UPI00108154FF|nr:efflux transporter outer membrane subunit [Thalassotalea sp. HSM 43]QBY03582.1 efflux transporter outer membrane subunit [Thalassotalea sp. HSM 43]
MLKTKNSLLRPGVSAALLIMIAGCQTPTGIDQSSEQLDLPEQYYFYQNTAVKQAEQESLLTLNYWLAELDNQTLDEMINKAIANNRQLQIRRFELAKAEQQLIISGASDWPELSLNVAQSRSKNIINDNSSINNNAEISLDLSYELDVWGRLSDQQKQSQLNFKIAQANYSQALADLSAEIVAGWYRLAEAQQLLELYAERAQNLKNNLEQIKSSYRLGLNQALDVYLTQNDVSSELARLAEQNQQVTEASRALQLLLGDYPSAALSSDVQLPSVQISAYAGVPSELISRRHDLNARWYGLLAADAGLAVAHKNRFPRIALTASTGDSSDQLDNLLDGGSLAWSIIGNISQPIFNAGRLEALEEQALLDVKITEQQYLDDVFQAFSDIENGVHRHQTLLSRFDHFQYARENAVAAEKLAFDQYLKGIVDYTTVLESQRRAFDAQTQLIQLKAQLLQNQVALALSLGGYDPEQINNERPSPGSNAVVTNSNAD